MDPTIKTLPWECEDLYRDDLDDLFIRREGSSEDELYDDYKKVSLHSYGMTNTTFVYFRSFPGKPKIFGGSCVDGQLTRVGQRQMEYLGARLRERYVNTFALLGVHRFSRTYFLN